MASAELKASCLRFNVDCVASHAEPHVARETGDSGKPGTEHGFLSRYLCAHSGNRDPRFTLGLGAEVIERHELLLDAHAFTPHAKDHQVFAYQ